MQHFLSFLQFRKLKIAGFLLLLFLGFGFVSVAQDRTVTGTVTDADSQETLPGASITLKGTTTGTVTDIDGKFSLRVPQGETLLVISYIGYETMELDATNLEQVNIALLPSRV